MKKLTFVIGLTLIGFINMLCFNFAYSTETFYEQTYQDHKLTDSVLYLYCDNSIVTIRPYTDDIIKVYLHPDYFILPDTSYVVVLKPEIVKFNLKEYSDRLEFSTKTVLIKIQKAPLKFIFIRDGKAVLEDKQGFFRCGTGKGVTFKLDSNEAIYGTGSRAIPIDRHGYSLILYNQNLVGYAWGLSWLNTNVPFYISSKMYGFYCDNFALSYCDAGNFNKDVLQYNVEYGNYSYFFVGGNSYSDILKKYTEITGRQPIPPRWALGYIQSRFGYFTEEEVKTVCIQLRDEKFPLDGIVLDLFWFGWQENMGNFDWYYPRYPNPKKMMSELEKSGIKTILVSEPYVDSSSNNFNYCFNNNLFTPDTNGKIKTIVLMYTPKGLLDIFKTETMDWLWGKYKERTSEGVGGWWCDLGEPEYHPEDLRHPIGDAKNVHNLYSFFWSKTIFDNYRKDFPDTRPFILTRANWAGCQKFSVFPVCGDEYRDWPAIKAQIAIMLGTGMSGLGYMHSDAGGLMGMVWDPELYERWFQLSSFQPVFRAHAAGVVYPEPIYWPDSVKKIIREVINLRYQFLPYNYNLCWENTTYGIPLARQLDFYEYQIPKLKNINDEYFWGEDILVAPVVDSAARKRDIILPKGNWIDFWDEKKYVGNQTVNIPAPIERIPLLVRAGSFIAIAPKMLTTQFYKYDSLIVKYYPDIDYAQTADSIYIDDGTTPDADKLGLFEFVKFSGSVKSNSIEINLSKSGQGYPTSPQNRDMVFDIRKINFKPGTITINGDFVFIVKTINEYNTFIPAGYYENQDESLKIHFNWDGKDTKINITDEISDVEDNNQKPERNIIINNIFPNPSGDIFIIDFDINISGKFQLKIYTYTGELVKTFNIDNHEVSNYGIEWDGKDDSGKSVSQGIYKCILSGEGEIQEKLIILKK